MKITCFIPFSAESIPEIRVTLKELEVSSLTATVCFLCDQDDIPEEFANYKRIVIDSLYTSATLSEIANIIVTDYILLYTKYNHLKLNQFALERFYQVAEDTQAGFVYADYYRMKAGKLVKNPLIDYREGSIRDDFDFGTVLFYRTEAFKKALLHKPTYKYAGLYDVRLTISRSYPVVRINEFLYTTIEDDSRLSGQKQFDYVDPKNREAQVEMECSSNEHLKYIGAYLYPTFKGIDFSENGFPVEASVIIPVYNREKTIADAISSVLMQKTTFPFNLIIINNYSTDNTGRIIDEFVQKSDKVIHLVPEQKNLGIGGCWNEGIFHAQCGKFAVQLDSDDIYSSENSLQTIVNAFYEQACPMIIGTYCMTNFNLEPILPGIIDHKEWTPDNGRNNALRINGLGAPRAFYTPLLRSIRVPNTSYGEDYALGLRISREYQIGRIYDVVYFCRRWGGNTDSALNIDQINTNNQYKDKIRTIEIEARKQLVKNNKEPKGE